MYATYKIVDVEKRGDLPMIRLGMGFIFIAIILWVLAVPLTFIEPSGFIFFAAIIAGFLGGVLVFVGVLRDRMKEIKEDDNDDLSKY